MEDRRSLCGDLATIANAIAGVARAHHLDAEQCEEWTQIAWLKVLGSTDLLSKQFRGEASFRTYLGTVLNNRCLDWLAHRSRSQQQAVPVDDVRMALERASARAFVDAALNTEERRRTERRSEVMHAAFEQLDSADRELLNAYFGERTARRALLVNSGCTPEALRQRVHRALARLRQLMLNNRPPARPPGRKVETGNLKLLCSSAARSIAGEDGVTFDDGQYAGKRTGLTQACSTIGPRSQDVEHGRERLQQSLPYHECRLRPRRQPPCQIRARDVQKSRPRASGGRVFRPGLLYGCTIEMENATKFVSAPVSNTLTQ